MWGGGKLFVLFWFCGGSVGVCLFCSGFVGGFGLFCSGFVGVFVLFFLKLYLPFATSPVHCVFLFIQFQLFFLWHTNSYHTASKGNRFSSTINLPVNFYKEMLCPWAKKEPVIHTYTPVCMPFDAYG